jgi:hypothetical protein
MKEKEYHLERIKINQIFSLFANSGKNNFPEMINKNKADQKLSISEYKKIIKQYFNIYFYEVYFLKRPYYFFFGGKLKLGRCGNFIRKNAKNGKPIAGKSIGLLWYDRPSPRFWFSIDILKLTGSTNSLPKIEREWKEKNDVSLLPLISRLRKDLKEKKQLFRL